MSAVVYIVQDGDHLSGIAEKFGFQKAETLWNDPSNADLRSLRDSPDMLVAGDEVNIPERQAKTISKPTGASHGIVVRAQRLELRLTFQDSLGKARGDVPVSLEVSGKSVDRITDGEGRVVMPVPRGVADATLNEDEREQELRVGALDPPEEVPGWHARLVNLGYLVGSPQEAEPMVRLTAIEEFEVDNDLEVTGEMTGATLAKLVEAHGS